MCSPTSSQRGPAREEMALGVVMFVLCGSRKFVEDVDRGVEVTVGGEARQYGVSILF